MRRWIATKGKYGEPPADYALFKAAQWMGVAPWELQTQALWWKLTAINYMNGEAEGQEIRDEHDRSKR